MCRPRLRPASSSLGWAVICLISHDLSLLSVPLSVSYSSSSMCGLRAGSITISAYRWSASPAMLTDLPFRGLLDIAPPSVCLYADVHRDTEGLMFCICFVSVLVSITNDTVI